MLRRFFVFKASALLVLGAVTGQFVRAADTPAAADSPPAEEKLKAGSGKLSPGQYDGRIANAVAFLLQRNHYLQHPLDNDFSEKFFNRYVEELDPQHMLFTEKDLDEFSAYRTTLDNLTSPRRGEPEPDTTPAVRLFCRFLERLDQRVTYVTDLLKTEKFEFNTDERMAISRRDAPFPADLTEAKELWRQRLRYEYLQEKLTRISAKSNTVAKADSKTIKETNTDSTTTTDKKKTDAEEIVELLTKRYNRTLHYFKELDSDDVLERYLTALAHVYDPHSDYMNKIGADNFAIGMNLALFGIGAELFQSEDGYCTIRRLTPNGPAEKSKKIKPNDRIIAVAQGDQPCVDVVDMNLNKAVQLIRGPKGTEVKLTIIPAAEPSERRIISLIRDEIKLEDQEAKAKVIELPDGKDGTVRLGVIDLPSFYATVDLSGRKANEPGARPTVRSTTADVAKLLKKLTKENVSGVILDLRRNGGGSLEEATALASLFIKGPVVQVRSPQHRPVALEDDNTPVIYKGPLVVLTSRGSASAAEIVAGALQDYGRALVVGDIATFGKGTVQQLNPLQQIMSPTDTGTNNPGTLKVTIRKYYRPSGTSTLFKGVLPDIVLPSVANYSDEIGEAALDEIMGNNYAKLPETRTSNTLGRDTIESAAFDKLDMVQSYVAELLKKSTSRIGTNQDFTYVREDIEQFRKLQADKTVSLNEKESLKERQENEARQKSRDKERQSRKEVTAKVHELKLKDVDTPGLPAALTKAELANQAKEKAELVWKSETTHTYTFGPNFRNYFSTVVVTNVAATFDLSKVDPAFANPNGSNVVISIEKVEKSIANIEEKGGNAAAVAALREALAKAEVKEVAPADKDEEPVPPVDATLDEAENILVDYIKLLGQKSLLSATK